MKVSEQIFIVGSGYEGFDMTNPYDCHVYLIDGGGDLVLIDIGAGMGTDEILNITRLGFDIQRILQPTTI